MRAREPDQTGYVDRDGVKIFYEVFGDGEPTLLLLPTWSIVHSRHWKAQVPYLSRHYRVVTFDGRGNGRSDSPEGAEAYTPFEIAGDALAVMDAVGVDRAVLVSLSLGASWSLILAAFHPERVSGAALIAPATPFGPSHAERSLHAFDDELDTDEGWAKYNRHYWERDYEGFLDFFFGQMFTEPHSTKQIEDCVGWGLETEPGTLADTSRALEACGRESFRTVCERVRCPVLAIHGDDDSIRPHAQSAALVEVTGGRLVTIEGGGHGPHTRDPVAVNHLISDFVDRLHPVQTPTTWVRASRRPKRALYLCSPIGLGHARRDMAIAAELRKHHPDLEIDWLAQHPVTTVLEHAGERVHPASVWLANETAHVEDECAEHDLHAFQAIRRMDEILVNNFVVFHDVVDEQPYDLVICDEAWDVDYFLHENPELKRFAFVWMTDFVGWIPMPSGGAHEADLTADYNAEMIEQRARFGRIRDRSSSASRTTSCPTASDPTCRASASGRNRTSSSAATSRASTRSSPPTAPHCATSSATARTSACASSPSADRASASRSCIASPTRLGRRDDSSTICASWSSPGHVSTSRRSLAVPESPTGVTSPTSTATSRRVTWPSCKAG
jgi:pimeloyl-ACP methyl ester carboxylesterase